MPDLNTLAQHREEILKAELAAWLHDVGKFSSKHIEHTLDGGSFEWQCDHSYKMVVDDPSSLVRLSPSAASVRKPDIINEIFRTRCLSSPKAANFLPGDIKEWMINETLDAYTVAEIIILGTPGFATSLHRTFLLDGKDGWLPAILGVAHHVAHHEKPEFKHDLKPQTYPKIYLDSPFGFSCFSLDISKKELEKCLDNGRRYFSNFDFEKAKRVIRKCFNFGWGDTRFPLNEVNLESWSLIVASLFKSQFAQFLITGKKSQIGQWKSWKDKIIDTNASWRLLSIRTDGLGYLLAAPSIPDLLARKDLLTDAWNRVQTLLEETYPLGLEVYRDENGPVFVVPDVDDVLALSNSTDNHKTLREYILEAFSRGTVKDYPCLAINGEIVPVFHRDDKPWKGQPAPQELPPIGDHLKKIPPLLSNPRWVTQQWCNLPEPEEICTVCGLRPQGPGKKAKERKMCDVCEKRREDRARAWAANIGRAFLATIWLDEVADQNGRLALIVGTFDLDYWLDGTLVRSLAVRNPKNVPDKTKTEDIAKNPSFARLRRIWETTRRFWEEILDQAKSELSKRPRIFLKGTVLGDTLGDYHAYELEIQGRKVAVLWVPPDAKDDKSNPLQYRGGFWVIENLDYLDKVYGRSFRELVQSLAEAEPEQPLQVYEPTEYGRPGEARTSFTISREGGVQYVENAYIPLIPVLAEPRTFMALVPADKALKVVEAIKAKYEREMGKVRNRLPLHIGIVYAHRRMPLRAILDAGRGMLEQKARPLTWEVMCSARKQIIKGDTLPERFEVDKDGQFREWYEVTLRSGHSQITWYVPAVMGDGQTEDDWYPYVFLASSDEPTTRNRYYKTDLGNPWHSSHPWLVHAAELQPGDRVYFTPATFDFIWLDHSGRRFEIAYDEHGHRLGTLHRPYLLDELPNLKRCWELLDQGLRTRQIHLLRDLIEGKRAEWFTDNPEHSLTDLAFRQFCEAVLHNAEWKKDAEATSEANMRRLIQWAVDGTLADAVELFYHIMKVSHGGSENKGE